MVQVAFGWWPSLRNFLILFFAVGRLAAQEAVTVDDYIKGLHDVLLNQGVPAAELYLKHHAEAGLDLTPMRKLIFEVNEGKRQKVEVRIHENNEHVLNFMQLQLERSRVDFVELVPVIDNTQPDVTKPFRNKEASFAKWQFYRKKIIPGLSFAATIAAATIPDAWRGGLDAIEAKKLIIAAVQGFVILRIELLTSIYATALNDALWSPLRFQETKPNDLTGKRLLERMQILLKGLVALATTSPYYSIPNLAKIVKNDASDSLRDLSKLLNRGLDLTAKTDPVTGKKGEPFIKAGYIYNYLFNFVYATAIHTVGWGMSFITGTSWETWHQFIGPNFIHTLGFYFAFGVNQTLIGVLNKFGIIDAHMRQSIEITSLYFAKPARIVSASGMGTVGTIAEVAVGLIGTLSTIRKLISLKRNAIATGRLYDLNAEKAAMGELVTKTAAPVIAAPIEEDPPFDPTRPAWEIIREDIKHIPAALTHAPSVCLKVLQGTYLGGGARLAH